MAKPIDYDALLKDFITDFFPEFIAFANPELYEAIDWSKGYVFLEQELINAFRGKWKIPGKRKHTDKLVKVQLKTDETLYIFIHAEFQHQPEPGFGRRMYEYRALIGLRYGIENITAIAVFTGASPPEEEQHYQRSTFGTTIDYTFKSIVAVNLDEQELIEASDNPFAIAMLAALYAQRSRNDPKFRLALKSKLFTLVRSKDIPFDKIIKMLIFVRDFVNLPQRFENEFQETQFSIAFPNTEAMTISQGTKDFASGLYERVFGYNPAVALEEEKKKNREMLAKERQAAADALRRTEEEHQRAVEALQREQEERQRAVEAMQREEEERQRLDNTIRYLYEKVNMAVSAIAEVVNKDVAYIEALLAQNPND